MGGHLGDRIDRFLRDRTKAVAALEAYFAPGRYTGRHFDRVVADDDPSANEVTAEDLVSLSFLGVPITGRAAERLLVDFDTQLDSGARRSIGTQLGQTDTRASLWNENPSIDGLLSPDGPAAALWTAFMSVPDFGWVRTNKLLARKRPYLFPVWDQVLQTALAPPAFTLWRPMREALREHGCQRVKILESLRSEALGVPDWLSPLRVLDVVVWMRAYGAGKLVEFEYLFDPKLADGTHPPDGCP